MENKRSDEILTKKDLFKQIPDKAIQEYNDFIEIDEYKVDLKSTGWRDTQKQPEKKMPKCAPDMVLSGKGVETGVKI